MTWQFIAVMVPGMLLLYVFSMVPVGRLYRLNSIYSPESWHENVVHGLYTPLLKLIAFNTTARDLTERYSAFWAQLIPNIPGGRLSWWRNIEFDKAVNKVNTVSPDHNSQQAYLDELSKIVNEP